MLILTTKKSIFSLMDGSLFRNLITKNMKKFNLRIVLIITTSLLIVQSAFSKQARNPNTELINFIKSIDGFVALWDFKELPGNQRNAIGKGNFPLQEVNGKITRVAEGPVSGNSIKLEGNTYLTLPNDSTNQLNIYGEGKQVTVIAFINWQGTSNAFVGGMWNEYKDGGKRQYGLFVSLPYYNGADQVCGHISKTGKPTPPFPYSIDYSASKQKVPKNEWCCVGLTYDGENIKSFFNGMFETRAPELIDHTTGFEGYPEGIVQSKNPYYFPDGMGNNGSDFTVGAVLLKNGMGNFFKGYIGGLAVFDKALTEKEMEQIYQLSVK